MAKKKQSGGMIPQPPQKSKVQKGVPPTKIPGSPSINPNKTSKHPPLPAPGKTAPVRK